MITLGSTYREVLSKLTTECADTLLSDLKNSFEIEDGDPIEEFLDAPTDGGTFSTGGVFFLVEDEDDLLTMIEHTSCADVRDTPSPEDIKFDVGVYLDSKEHTALLMSCTSDDGGNTYIICRELLEEFPSIHEHIFRASNE